MNKSVGNAWELEHSIASEPLEACELIRQVVGRLESDCWGEDSLFAVHMALEEAVMNAIKHGNKRDVSKQVHVSVRCSGDQLSMKVRDEGEGFVPCDVPDPTEDCNLDKPCGRGVLLIREFMDEVSYNECGNEVCMLKRRSS